MNLDPTVVEESLHYYEALIGKRLEAHPRTASTDADGLYTIHEWFSKLEEKRVVSVFSRAELEELLQVCKDLQTVPDKFLLGLIYPAAQYPRMHVPNNTIAYIMAGSQLDGAYRRIEKALEAGFYVDTAAEPWSQAYYEEKIEPVKSKKFFWQRAAKKSAKALPEVAVVSSGQQISLTQRKLGALLTEVDVPEARELLAISRRIILLPGYQQLGVLLRTNVDKLLGADTLEVVNNFLQEPKHRTKSIESFRLLVQAYTDYYQLVEESVATQSDTTHRYLEMKYRPSSL